VVFIMLRNARGMCWGASYGRNTWVSTVRLQQSGRCPLLQHLRRIALIGHNRSDQVSGRDGVSTLRHAEP
jgi:hypothetical protein